MSKNKGSSFERSLCNKLSRFVDPDGKETIFWRSAMSGGRATVQNKKGGKNTRQLGDITAIDPRGAWLNENFIVEAKHYKKLDIESFLLKKTGVLYGFWRKLRKLCKKHSLHPILIAKQNNLPTLLLTTELAIDCLDTFGADINNPLLRVVRDKRNVWIFNFEEVFK